MKKLFLITLLLAILGVSCVPVNSSSPTGPVILLTTTPTPGEITLSDDAGVLSGVPCQAPCFYGIIAGQTRSVDVLNILNQNGVVNCIEYDTYLNCAGAGIYFNEQFVSTIGFQPQTPIPLKKLLDRFGPPDHIAVIDRTFMADVPVIDVYFYYDDKHMVFASGQHQGTTVKLNEDVLIYCWNYFDASSYQADLSIWQASGDSAFPSRVFDWEGYGNYSP